jgi:hypothetical protein
MAKSRKLRRKSKNKHTRKIRHHRQKRQSGGGFSYEIPPDAIVEHRDMDDGGTNPPRLMTKRQMDSMISDSERA